MSYLLADAARVALIGIGATAVMDAWLIVLKKLNVPTLNFAMIGRWVGHLCHGQWFHDGITKAAPIRGELPLGWLTHYVTGILFAALLVSVYGIEWAHEPGFVPAILIGMTTVAAPLFVMQPAFGAGIAFSNTATPVRSCIKSIANHAVFGCGLYISALVLAYIH